MGTFVKVAKTSDLAAGQGKIVEANGREIALFNVGGSFHAIDNTCKHRGGPLGEGELDGTVVTCPLHAWTYDVTSGECFDDPACAVDTFPVKVEGEDVLIEI
jgi:NAD(P)H-dependent nitrite reductase small subunit